MRDWLSYSDEVSQALASDKPVVALESTLISHGFSYPENADIAQELEAIIRDGGAIPATIAVIGGQVKIGLKSDEIEKLARIERKSVKKLSTADLPVALSTGLPYGSTTVAATMYCAHAARIKVFATGGIGGVHKGVSESWDISADLIELSRTPVTVVCSGAKAILDLPKTLEYLETQRVPVIGFRTSALPQFFTNKDDLPLTWRVDSVDDITLLMARHREMQMRSGILVTNPVPADVAPDENDVDDWLEQAQDEADSLGISGKNVTPYMLSRLVELSDGQTVRTNKAVLKSNAALATQIAIAL